MWQHVPVENQRDTGYGKRTWSRPMLRRLSGGSAAESGYNKFPVETVIPIGPYGTFAPAGPGVS